MERRPGALLLNLGKRHLLPKRFEFKSKTVQVSTILPGAFSQAISRSGQNNNPWSELVSYGLITPQHASACTAKEKGEASTSMHRCPAKLEGFAATPSPAKCAM